MEQSSSATLFNPTRWRVGTSSVVFRSGSEDELKAYRQAGIDDAELRIPRNADQGLSELDQVVARMKGAGMRLWSVHLPFGRGWDVSVVEPADRKAALDRQRAILKRIAHWSPAKAVIHPSAEPVSDEERTDRLKLCAEALRTLSHEAHGHGIQLAAECLPRSCLGNTAEEIQYIVDHDETGRLGVCCDVNHVLRETPQAFIRQLGSHIVTVHMSDYDGRDEKHWLPGRGGIDWNAVLANLVAAGYSGPFMFEVARKPNPDIEDDIPGSLAACWDRLCDAFDRASTGDGDRAVR